MRSSRPWRASPEGWREGGKSARGLIQQRGDLGKPMLGEQRHRVITPVVEIACEHERAVGRFLMDPVRDPVHLFNPRAACEREVCAQQRDGMTA